jgi:signal transduction histidine kinase
LLLGQLLDNLVDNALKYSEPGSPVTVSLLRDAGAVLMTVADAGWGIGPEDLPHVFEPFYRSASARRLGRGGVGLGLAMARRIAEAFGGHLGVASEPGRGSRFTLRLPTVVL